MPSRSVGERIGSAAEGFASGFLPSWKELRRGKEAKLDREIQSRRVGATEQANILRGDELQLGQDQLAAQRPVYEAQADHYAAQAKLNEQRAGVFVMAHAVLEGLTGGGNIAGTANQIFPNLVQPPQQRPPLDRIIGAEPTSSPRPQTTEDILSADPMANPNAVAPFQSRDITSSSIETPAPRPQPQPQQQSPFAIGNLFGPTNTGQGPEVTETPAGPMSVDMFSSSGPLNATAMPTMPVDARVRLGMSIVAGLDPMLSGFAPSNFMAPAEIPWTTQIARELMKKGQGALVEKLIANFNGEGARFERTEQDALGQAITIIERQSDAFGSRFFPGVGDVNVLEDITGVARGTFGQDFDPENPEKPRFFGRRSVRFQQPMSEGQRTDFMALGAVNNLLHRVGRLAIALNTSQPGLGATFDGWVNRAKATLNMPDKGQQTREYLNLREAFGGQLAQMGGEGGGRFTDQDIARAQQLLPLPEDSAELTLAKLRAMYESLNTGYQTALAGAPFVGNSPTSVPPPSWYVAMDDSLVNALPALPVVPQQGNNQVGGVEILGNQTLPPVPPQ
jgi:hypothetical protein